jgi:hypothetical protein
MVNKKLLQQTVCGTRVLLKTAIAYNEIAYFFVTLNDAYLSLPVNLFFQIRKWLSTTQLPLKSGPVQSGNMDYF